MLVNGFNCYFIILGERAHLCSLFCNCQELDDTYDRLIFARMIKWLSVSSKFWKLQKRRQRWACSHKMIWNYMFVYLLFHYVILNYFRWTGPSVQPFLRLSGTRWHIWSFDHESKNSWKKMWGHPGCDRGQIKNTLASRGNKGSDWQVICLWHLK